MKKVPPLLDIHLYYENPPVFVEQLRIACHEIGFFLLKHDIPSQLAQRQLEETSIFFRRPLEEKLEISYEKNRSFRGYMKLGVENTAGVTDIREQIEFASEAKVDHVRVDDSSCPPYYERLRGANPWPDPFQPELRKTTEEYVDHACRIAHIIREALSLALGLDKEAMDPLFGRYCNNSSIHAGKEGCSKYEEEKAHWALKLVSYPPVVAPDDGNGGDNDDVTNRFGVGAHTDTNFLTLILQDTVGGLQAFSQGEWFNIPSHFGPNVLVCNLGEQAEILSKGYFLATPHRVLANTHSSEQRISVPLFYNPRLSATIQPLNSFHEASLNWERPRNYEKERHWRNKNNTVLCTVGENTFKSLARSHPIVFQRHHSDLTLLDDGRIIRKEV